MTDLFFTYKLTIMVRLSNDVPALKRMMSIARTVKEWNTLREKAKTLYSPWAINQLDASAFIVKVLSTPLRMKCSQCSEFFIPDTPDRELLITGMMSESDLLCPDCLHDPNYKTVNDMNNGTIGDNF